jgi:hypothetical protein
MTPLSWLTPIRFALSLYPKFLFNNLSAFETLKKLPKYMLTSPKQMDNYSSPEGMTALVLNRFGEAAVAKMKSKEKRNGFH